MLRRTSRLTSNEERAARELRVHKLVEDSGKYAEGTPLQKEIQRNYEREALGGLASEVVRGRLHREGGTFSGSPENAEETIDIDTALEVTGEEFSPAVHDLSANWKQHKAEHEG